MSGAAANATGVEFSTTLTLKSWYAGDANRDGQVGAGDLGLLAAHYGASLDDALSLAEPGLRLSA